jgi:hypothetical protein
VGGKVWWCVLVVAAVGFGAAGCSSGYGSCGKSPSNPKTIRTASFFGRVTADPQKWTVARAPGSSARLVVANRAVLVDSTTERVPSSCEVGSRNCYAFVGMGPSGIAAWILLADAPPRANAYSAHGELEVSATVWKVRDATLVLSQGLELRFSKALSQKMAASDSAHDGYSLRHNLEHDTVGADLYLDPGSGSVLAASFGGCA